MARESHRWMPVFFASTEAHVETGIWQPQADVYRTRTGWVVKVDLAGVLPEDVKLTTEGSRLTVVGLRRDSTVQEGCRHYHMEISYCRFERTIDLPEPIEPGHLVAEFWHGFLLVRIEREDQP